MEKDLRSRDGKRLSRRDLVKTVGLAVNHRGHHFITFRLESSLNDQEEQMKA